jgi:hypothetical protein
MLLLLLLLLLLPPPPPCPDPDEIDIGFIIIDVVVCRGMVGSAGIDDGGEIDDDDRFGLGDTGILYNSLTRFLADVLVCHWTTNDKVFVC